MELRISAESIDESPLPDFSQEALGESEVFLEFQERLSQLAQISQPVLIIGERGTGKELAARRLHYLSRRWEEPLVTLNCAALSPGLIESELFGYGSGAFTGASQKGRAGRFEAADGGTLFLDELGNIPREAQEKILRAVEYGSFERVGESISRSADVRIIGATNADLPAMAEEGKFMRDLLDRLSFEVVFVPPLRERREDIMLLAIRFAAKTSTEIGLEDVPQFSDRAIETLENYSWPGNIRELKSVVGRAVLRGGSEEIDEIIIDPFAENPYQFRGTNTQTDRTKESPKTVPESSNEAGRHSVPACTLDRSLPEQVSELETMLLKKALEECHHNRKRAAEKLGITYNQFRGLYKKHIGG